MRVGKYKTRPPISHGANTSVEGDHISIVIAVVKARGLS